MNKIIGIYKITNLINGKVYIGESNNIKRRFNEYKSLKCKGQRKLYNSFACHGLENHKFEIIMECAFEDLKYFESCFQEIYIVVEKGLNLIYTGRDEKKGSISEETRKKRSENHHTKKEGYVNPLKGVPKSEETKEKMRIGNIGKKMSVDACKKMSEAQKRLYENGYVNPMKGKIGEKNHNYGKPCSLETRKKISDAQKGKKISEEQILKRLKTITERYNNGELEAWNKGKNLSEDHKQKLSENHWSKKEGYLCPNGKKVINTETGEIYNSSAECERKTGYKNLRAKLAGSRKNNTPFKYL
jgi:group I intron endonuclease